MKYNVPKGKAKMKIYLEKEVVAVNLEKLKVFYKRVSKKLDRIIAETSEEVMRGQSVEDLGEDLDDLDDGEEGEEEDGEGRRVVDWRKSWRMMRARVTREVMMRTEARVRIRGIYVSSE